MTDKEDRPAPDSRVAAARERLLQTAVQMLGERGISGVSLRGIGAAAGQKNNSAVAYHFHGKVGLMNAIVAELHDFLAPRFDALFSELESRSDGMLTMYEVALAIAAPLFALYLSKPRGESALKTLAKFLHERPEAIDETYWGTLQDLVTRAIRLVLQVRPRTPVDQASLHVTHALKSTTDGLATLHNWPIAASRHDPELMFQLLLIHADFLAGGLSADEASRPAIDIAYWKESIVS
ncbi:TetR family transcriptional regulator [Variovorax sp. J31P207]|uniref:TetR family transcriptional regulator n=1 Tax=Variovorax sp. J31P207 TaxID=3053510 RepID=UPI002577D27F|nr:TetR family transcriptional regulator [Variovorax sp. J31P207]MDM0066987.1 TetR family transcriptional regulator [Variovorax sp. J31P207]